MSVPRRPKLYHVTHGANLRAIIEAGGLLADSEAVQGVSPMKIGNAEVVSLRKRRPVPCHPGTCVGDYVPFYFCPRSVMLYVISHPEPTCSALQTRNLQKPIVHLEADLHRVVTWAQGKRVRWAFTLSNAARGDAEFRRRIDCLSEVNWAAVAARWWTGPLMEPKQAEFLVYRSVPWSMIERIGVMNDRVAQRVSQITAGTPVCVEVRSAWYY